MDTSNGIECQSGCTTHPFSSSESSVNLQKLKFAETFVFNYFVDFIIYSRTYQEHLPYLKQPFEMVKDKDTKLKLSECQFDKKTIIYLGFQISKNEVKALKRNVEAIENVMLRGDGGYRR